MSMSDLHIFYKQLHFGPAEPLIFENQGNSASNFWDSKWKENATIRFFEHKIGKNGYKQVASGDD